MAFLDRAEFLLSHPGSHPRPAAAMMVYQAILRPCLSRLPRNASIDQAVQAINEAVAATGSMKPLTLFETCRRQVITHQHGMRFVHQVGSCWIMLAWYCVQSGKPLRGKMLMISRVTAFRIFKLDSPRQDFLKAKIFSPNARAIQGQSVNTSI